MPDPSATPTPSTTPLIDLHRELGGRLVDFAGWELPIQYAGVIAEHTQCRTAAGLFDVSHMGVVEVRGDNPAAALERVTPAGITSLDTGAMRYALLTADNGGLLDDWMVTNRGDHLMIVVNASRRHVDIPHLHSHLGDHEIIVRDDVALLALQGPTAVDALARLSPGIAELFFLQAADFQLGGVPVTVSRSGYTGEDGFELVVPAEEAEALARQLLTQPEVAPCGLGARDTLRLEAGLCLYGNDLDLTTTPVEADLRWTIPKRRREAKDFPGADQIMDQYLNGASRKRVGLKAEGRRPVREHSVLSTPDGTVVGEVTSGGYGPSVEHPVAMGYVTNSVSEVGTSLLADVRGSLTPIEVAPLPFTPHRYHRQPKNA